MTGFHGAKAALLTGDCLVALLRDDRPDIDFPGLWDLPGGGREGDETPEQTVLREVAEETGLALAPGALTWCRAYAAGPRISWFFAGRFPSAALGPLRLGAEGQRLVMMPVAEFLSHPRAIPHLQARLADCLAELAPAGGQRRSAPS